MNRTQLIEKITEHTGVEKKAVANVLAGLGDVVLASVAKGDSVMLPGIAKFTKVKRKARMGRNPATGAPVKIAAKTVAKVTALKLYKETVLGNSPAPKLQKVAAAASTPARTTAARATKAAPAKATTTRATAAKPAARSTRAAATTRAATTTRATSTRAASTTKAAPKPRATKAAASTVATAPATKAPAKPRATRARKA